MERLEMRSRPNRETTGVLLLAEDRIVPFRRTEGSRECWEMREGGSGRVAGRYREEGQSLLMGLGWRKRKQKPRSRRRKVGEDGRPLAAT